MTDCLPVLKGKTGKMKTELLQKYSIVLFNFIKYIVIQITSDDTK